ncbi:uncharacterized protein Z518_11297 [Rhinocladiella mackenziei CBS 650.93]|uniref:Aminoglycoside phosphotransferase domain-containing protein n=1 Tax=Rhinocladiella mackenziei CBS 650.93 TaxID=1442369 RepID=A0A0D2I1G8_9EURO|nr:uncharacterized protein Z518_11297 [Rhinocladiella mackenziei CBS 650.93]KIW99558.1 hypothetical protein Z518_11297 [Rhinocladiella mackenziei CBS 650.93]
MPHPDSNKDHFLRVKNEVATLSLLRDALGTATGAIVPRIYGSNSSGSGHAWILLEWLPGINLGKIFSSCSLEQQRLVLSQLANMIHALQNYQLPDTVDSFGGLRHNRYGEIVSGESSCILGGPFTSMAAMYKHEATERLKLSDSSEIIAGWRHNALRGRLDSFVADGIEKAFEKLSMGQKGIVHGAITLDNILIDPDTFKLSGLLGGDMSYIATPIHEFFHSFYDLYNFLPGPYTTNTQNLIMHKALLHGFPEPLPETVLGGASDEKSSKFGAGVGIDWRLSQMFAEELEKAGALGPAQIADAEEIAALYWFVQAICPPYLFNHPALKARELQAMYRQTGEVLLDKYLVKWGY